LANFFFRTAHFKESSLLLRRTVTPFSFIFGGQLEFNFARAFTEIDRGDALIFRTTLSSNNKKKK